MVRHQEAAHLSVMTLCVWPTIGIRQLPKQVWSGMTGSFSQDCASLVFPQGDHHLSGTAGCVGASVYHMPCAA